MSADGPITGEGVPGLSGRVRSPGDAEIVRRVIEQLRRVGWPFPRAEDLDRD